MRIRMIVYQDVNLLDIAGPAQAFEAAGRLQNKEPINIEYCMPGGGRVRADTGLAMEVEDSKTLRGAPDILMVPGSNTTDVALQDDALIDEIRRQAHLSKLVTSICTGSALLARAGLLEGRRAATHWRYAARFAALFPDTAFDADAIYVQDGHVWTSAGVSAGIDMSLALIGENFGRSFAVEVARDLVVPLIRTGGQKQFSDVLKLQSLSDTESFVELHEWISLNLHADLRVDALAKRCNMSSRSFARKYTQCVGVPPAKMVEGLRVDHALQLLETSDASMKEIAGVCGFASVNAMRLAVRRAKGVDPTNYRNQFGLEKGAKI